VNRGLPKQKLLRSSGPLWYSIILTYSLAFVSCNHQDPRLAIRNPGKKPQELKKENFTPPKITHITASNLPTTVIAGKPIIKADSTNGGLPFFTNYGIEQGLPSNRINKSAIDNAGNLWFGTADGVSKYDGKKFTNYSSANGLPESGIWTVMQDNEGNIWFGTENKGVSKYDGKTFVNYDKAQGLGGHYVISIMQDHKGNIWFGTDNGVSKFDKRIFTNYEIRPGLVENYTHCIIEDKEGNLWFGTSNGVYKYDGKSFKNYSDSLRLSKDNAEVQSIIQDSKGNIWFSSWGQGATKYDGKTYKNFTTKNGLADNKIRYITEDKRGDIWFATVSGGVSRYDGEKFKNYSVSQGLADNSVRGILEDYHGDFWFSTIGGGIGKLNNSELTYYSAMKWLPSWNIKKIQNDKNGNIWIGSENGITKYDGNDFCSYTSSQGLSGYNIGSYSEEVSNTMIDCNGNRWFGADKGIYKYDGQHFTYYSSPQGLVSDEVFSMIQDIMGNIWIGTPLNGVYKFDGNSFTNYDSAQGLGDHLATSIIQDRRGNLWFGTSKGVCKYDGKLFTNYTSADGLPSDTILCMIQDRGGNLWFGTWGGGLSRYDGRRFINFNADAGLTDNKIVAMVEDSIRNMLWLGTGKGLSVLRLDSISNNVGNFFENFDINTGYSISGIKWQSLCLDNRDVLWFGCEDNKIMKFDYALANKNKKPLILEIQGIKVNNENICWNNLIKFPNGNKLRDSLSLLNEMAITFGKSLPRLTLDSMRNKFDGIKFDSLTSFNPVPVNLVLPYKDNNLSIDFVAIEPAKPKQVKYQYKLEGYDKDWSPPVNSTTAVFGNIPEGTYTFRLRALSPYGVWSETAYQFKVLPPWYRTWWAYSVFALILIGTIWSLIYYRSKQLRRVNRILEEKVEHRTEQLKQSLENLRSTQSQLIQSEKMASLGELTAGIAHEIQNPLNFVNNFSEINKELAGELQVELKSGRIDEAIAISNDIINNEEKINHHGKRADAIVKGMLQHSRNSSSIKEATNINALADEYLRLSYHGLRAKDKVFNATINTDFDKSIGNINIIPQDIGRVLLNLYNNAFYAVDQKKKAADADYIPTVSVTTKKTDNKIILTVKDNGNGIPQRVVDKIFQPFFTTKPTGQGTGLGLSLSYDLVKVHGGEIMVDSKEGEGSEFIIQLPV
jgi:ligand-binding sensor domain-containing protein/signal transduction histidine kinase